MSGLIGKKIGMTSVFSAEGKNIPCTVIEAGPCVVTQVKTVEKDGYAAVQLAYDDKKEKHTSKPMMGHFAKANTTPKRKIAEFKSFETMPNLGDVVGVDVIEEGEWVDVTGISKGKGFQGVVKRHGFGGVGGQTHGPHNRQRHVGSLGPYRGRAGESAQPESAQGDSGKQPDPRERFHPGRQRILPVNRRLRGN